MEDVNNLYDKLLRVGSNPVKEASDVGSPEWNETDIDLDVIPDGDFEVSSSDKVHIDYSFNMDWRKWGIKDIEIMLSVDPQFNVSIDGRDVDVTVPVGSINISWVAGRHYIPISMSVTVDNGGRVKSAELNVSYIEH